MLNSFVPQVSQIQIHAIATSSPFGAAPGQQYHGHFHSPATSSEDWLMLKGTAEVSIACACIVLSACCQLESHQAPVVCHYKVSQWTVITHPHILRVPDSPLSQESMPQVHSSPASLPLKAATTEQREERMEQRLSARRSLDMNMTLEQTGVRWCMLQ